MLDEKIIFSKNIFYYELQFQNTYWWKHQVKIINKYNIRL